MRILSVTAEVVSEENGQQSSDPCNPMQVQLCGTVQNELVLMTRVSQTIGRVTLNCSRVLTNQKKVTHIVSNLSLALHEHFMRVVEISFKLNLETVSLKYALKMPTRENRLLNV